jgi:RHS repeat-associated protein
MKFGKLSGILFFFVLVASTLFATVSEKPRQGLVSIFEDLQPASEPSETVSNAGDQPPEAVRIHQANQFTGRKLESFTGLYNNRNRYYSPKVGRFITRDPIGFWGDVNLYRYANGNPTRFIDPFGLASVSEIQEMLDRVRERIVGTLKPGSPCQTDLLDQLREIETFLQIALINEAFNEAEELDPTQAGKSIEVTRKFPKEKLKFKPKKRGNAPIGEDGKPIELHHTDQSKGNSSPRVEATRTEHRGPGNYKKEHSNTGQEPSTIDRTESRRQHKDHWRDEWDAGRFDDLPEQD